VLLVPIFTARTILASLIVLNTITITQISAQIVSCLASHACLKLPAFLAQGCLCTTTAVLQLAPPLLTAILPA